MMKNAIILCSGGLDSVVTSYYVRKQLKYDKMVILFFNYGQRTINKERKSAKKCAESLKAGFKEISLKELKKISPSLINSKKPWKKLLRKDLKNSEEESKKYYVPFRNGIFLSYAIALAESYFSKFEKKFDIFVGFKNEGQESYPDATPGFIRKMNSLQGTKIIAPLIKKDKEDIVKLGVKLKVNLKNTYSCYTSNKRHCGTCLACKLRQEGFYWSGVEDNTDYGEKI